MKNHDQEPINDTYVLQNKDELFFKFLDQFVPFLENVPIPLHRAVMVGNLQVVIELLNQQNLMKYIILGHNLMFTQVLKYPSILLTPMR